VQKAVTVQYWAWWPMQHSAGYGGWEVIRVIHQTLSVPIPSQTTWSAVSLWKQQGALNACICVPMLCVYTANRPSSTCACYVCTYSKQTKQYMCMLCVYTQLTDQAVHVHVVCVHTANRPSSTCLCCVCTQLTDQTVHVHVICVHS